MVDIPELTKEEYDVAVKRAEDSLCAVAFAYDEKSRTIRVHLDNDTSIIFPLTMLPALRNATPTQIRNVRFMAGGMDLWWDDLDVQHTVEYIIGKATGTIAPPQKKDNPKASTKRVGSKTEKKKKTLAKKREKVAA